MWQRSLGAALAVVLVLGVWGLSTHDDGPAAVEAGSSSPTSPDQSPVDGRAADSASASTVVPSVAAKARTSTTMPKQHQATAQSSPPQDESTLWTDHDSPPPCTDELERKFHCPAGTKAVSGRNDVAQWALYVRHNAKMQTCLDFYSAEATGAGGGGTCHQELPLDASGSEGKGGAFVDGLVTAKAVRVRVEYTAGDPTDFDAIAVDGFVEKFYAGELRRGVPLKRIVAFDANGKQVAEKTDVTAMNTHL